MYKHRCRKFSGGSAPYTTGKGHNPFPHRSLWHHTYCTSYSGSLANRSLPLRDFLSLSFNFGLVGYLRVYVFNVHCLFQWRSVGCRRPRGELQFCRPQKWDIWCPFVSPFCPLPPDCRPRRSAPTAPSLCHWVCLLLALGEKVCNILQRRRRRSDSRTATRSYGRSSALLFLPTSSRCTCRREISSPRATGTSTRRLITRKPSPTRTGTSWDTVATCARDFRNSARIGRTFATCNWNSKTYWWRFLFVCWKGREL